MILQESKQKYIGYNSIKYIEFKYLLKIHSHLNMFKIGFIFVLLFFSPLIYPDLLTPAEECLSVCICEMKGISWWLLNYSISENNLFLQSENMSRNCPNFTALFVFQNLYYLLHFRIFPLVFSILVLVGGRAFELFVDHTYRV